MNIFSNYYQKDLEKLIDQIIPQNNSSANITSQKLSGKYDYLILTNSLSSIDDIQVFLEKMKKNCHSKTKIIVIYFNFLWKPLLNLATNLSLRKSDSKEPNWLSTTDISNLFYLEEFELIKNGHHLLIPINLNFLTTIINKYIAHLPIVNHLCLTTYQIFRLKPKPKKYSVSIVIPAKNEAGNIKGILKKIPKLGTQTEVIFVEGNSTDNTYDTILNEIKTNKRIKASVFKQKGEGKGSAVRLGFSKAKNDILMILDADLTVPPSNLQKFYNALSKGHTEFANGSRLVYPMEKQAMRTLNYFGNKIFSILFTYLLGQKIKDTLCGTKALFREDYLKIVKNRKVFGDFDPFGDFDLLFGASKLNLKITDIPIKYRERTYGTTNISRFSHGWLLLKMTLFAARKIKFI